jgi:hypothetical protein
VYLAKNLTAGKWRYSIRESVRHADGFIWRELFDLGRDPGRFIVYPGGNAFYVDEQVEEAIRELGAEPGMEEMEDLFWPFLRPEIRAKLEPFRRQEQRQKDHRRPSERSDPPEVHLFDRRRIHYLKTGRMTPRSLDRLPLSALRRLQSRSRDEIENDFLRMEAILRPREYKPYTYAIFNLQQCFEQRFAREHPEFLDPDEVDACFIEALCRLNSDQRFWLGLPPGGRLGDHLVRYAVMFFDHDFAARSFAADDIRDFMNRRRAYRPPPTSISMQEVSAIFGKSLEVLRRMGRRDLLRLYRRRAQELHPDKGGDHERFLQLSDAYHKLLRSKR